MLGTAAMSWGFGLAGMIFCALVTMLWSLVLMLVYTACARCCRNKEVTPAMLIAVDDVKNKRHHSDELPKPNPTATNGKANGSGGVELAAVVPVSPLASLPPTSPRVLASKPRRYRDAIGVYVPPPKPPKEGGEGSGGPGPADANTTATGAGGAAAGSGGGGAAGVPQTPTSPTNPNMVNFPPVSISIDQNNKSSEPPGGPKQPPLLASKQSEDMVTTPTGFTIDNSSNPGKDRPSFAARQRSGSRMLLPRWNKRPFPCGVLQG